MAKGRYVLYIYMRSLLILFCLLLVSGTGLAQDPPAAIPAQKLAWRIQPPAGPAFTLQASAAFLSVQDYPLPPYVRDLYASAQVILVESDFKALENPAFGEALNAKMPLDKGTLSQEAGPDLYRLIREQCEDLKVTTSALGVDRLRPWAAGIRIFSYGNARMGLEGRYALDQAIYTMALVDGKRVIAFEAPAQTLELLTNWPSPELEKDFVRHLLLEQTLLQQNLTLLRGAWRRGDWEYLDRNLLRPYEKLPEVHAHMIGSRASRWAGLLASGEAAPENSLAIIPSIYLAGEGGLLATLQTAGCQVTRLE